MIKKNVNVIAARLKKGFTQTMLREKLKEEFSIGMSPNKIVAIEKGDFSNLKHNEMAAIGKILDASVEELFFND